MAKREGNAGADQLACMPPPAPRRTKQVVLSEEEYTSRLAAIIERDFFPDLPKTRAKLQASALAQATHWRTCTQHPRPCTRDRHST